MKIVFGAYLHEKNASIHVKPRHVFEADSMCSPGRMRILYWRMFDKGFRLAVIASFYPIACRCCLTELLRSSSRDVTAAEPSS